MSKYCFRYIEYVPFTSKFVITAESKGEAQGKARRAIDDEVFGRLWRRGFMEPFAGQPSINKKVELLEEVSADFKDDFVPVLRIKDE